MESVIDTIADAGDLVLDTLGSAPDVVVSGGRRRGRSLLVLLLIGAVIGIVLWRRSQAAGAEDAAAPDRS